MIEKFKDTEIRNSGIVYDSALMQIKKLYEADPERAGELAISVIEFILTGEISSDDMMIDLLLEPIKKITENNQVKYDTKVENARQKKIRDMKLDKIAELHASGLKQRQIGERLGLSQQIVSYRMAMIRTEYPELLGGNSTKIQTNLQNLQTAQKTPTKIQIDLQTTYKNTNDTKTHSFVQENLCKNSGVEGENGDETPVEPAWKSEFSF